MPRFKNKFRTRKLLLWIVGILVGAALGGFLALFFYYFLRNYLPLKVVVPLAIGLAVMLTFFSLRLMRLQSRMFSGVSPLIAGVLAGLGVHMARFWLP